jgi:hypothetical protein
MPRTSPRRTIALFLLAAVLFTPWAAWAGSPGSRLSPAGPAAWGGLDLLRHLWSRLTSVWSETGANIDPGGGCAPAAPAAPGDEGANIDPSGGTLPAPDLSGDEGANIDPDGRSAPRSRAALPADTGANIDPDGFTGART